jgi:UDP-3-O-[3-hydroxymyristoyl] glucosamine N-acyltransferase
VNRARRLDELAREASAELFGDAEGLIEGVAPLDAAGPRDLSIFHHPRYKEQFLRTRAGAVVVQPDAVRHQRPGQALLVSRDPYLTFAKIARIFRPLREAIPGRDPRCAIDPTASVDPGAEVRAFAFVGAGARVGPGTVLHPFSHVGDRAQIGAQCVLHAGAVVEELCVLGDRVTLHAGAVVGGDGFGYAFEPPSRTASPASEGAHLKVPQIGIVRIEDDVEIGAHSCVDRAAMGETVIGRGTKIDNLVQVAHNVKIGPLSLVCAQAGIAGSSRLGAGVVLGGQVGVIGHRSIADGAKVAAGAGVMDDIPAGEVWSGSPALPHPRWLRQVAAERQLSDRLRSLADLEKRLLALEEKLKG